MKLFYSFFLFLIVKNANAQENIFIGKIAYVKEAKLLSGEFVPRGNADSETFFNASTYTFAQKSTIDLDALAGNAVKKISKENQLDSFELVRQRKKIKEQLESKINPSISSKSFINFKSHVSQKPRSFNEKNYCVIDSLPKIDWQLKEDTMTIEGLFCQKARGYFIDNFYEVWFAPSVPFSAGPLNMHGLPGIIVLATSEDGKKRYRMKNLNYPLVTPVKIDGCNGGKQISQIEFTLIQSKGREEFNKNIQEFKNKNEGK
jgi:GLPGLI family protein